MATELKKIVIKTREDRDAAIAFYGERLGQHLLHLPLPPWDRWRSNHMTQHFDFIDADGVRAQVEVKMFNNKDRVVIYADQLEDQLNEPTFPVEDKVIMMVNYNNQGPSERRVKQGSEGFFKYSPRLLPQFWIKRNNRNMEAVSNFLSREIRNVNLIDIRLLGYWVRKYGTRDFSRYGKDNPDRTVRPIVPISRTDIERFVAHTRERLLDLDVSNEEIALWLPPGAQRVIPRKIETVLDGNTFRFNLNILLANGVKHRFLRKMNGNVVKTPVASSQLIPAYA